MEPNPAPVVGTDLINMEILKSVHQRDVNFTKVQYIKGTKC